jgi:hypothetical protein
LEKVTAEVNRGWGEGVFPGDFKAAKLVYEAVKRSWKFHTLF